MKRHDKIEQLFNDALRDHEAKFDPNAWSELSQKMGPSSPGASGSLWQKAWPWVAGAGTIAAVVTAVALWPDDAATEAKEVTKPGIAQQVEDTEVTLDELSEETINIQPAELDIQVEGKGVVRINLKETDGESHDVIPATPDQELVNVITQLSQKEESSSLPENGTPDKPSGPSEVSSEVATPVIAAVSSVCAGDQVSFSVDNPEFGTMYKWFVDGQEVARGPFFEASFDKAKGYTVNVVAQRGNGKAANKAMSEKLVMVNAPSAEFTFSQNMEGLKPVYKFQMESFANTNVVWNFGDGSTKKGLDASHVFDNVGKYEVMATVTDQNGCKTSYTKPVTVHNTFNPLVPTAFSPNGDARNQYLIPMAQEVRENPFIFTVYDSRTGALVFESKNINQKWDGIERNTGRMPENTKVYVWQLRVMGDKNENFTGHVTLVK